MKKQTVSLLVLLLAASGFFFSCGNTMNKNAGALEFDSIQVNETAHLFGDTAKPACNLIINLAYASQSSDGKMKDSLNTYFLSACFGEKYMGMKEEVGTLNNISYDDDKDEYTYTLTVSTTTSTGTTTTTPAYKSSKDYSKLYGLNVKVLYKTTSNKTTVYGMYAKDSSIVASGKIGDLDIVSSDTNKIKIDGTEYKLNANMSTDALQMVDAITGFGAFGGSATSIPTLTTSRALNSHITSGQTRAYTFDLLDTNDDDKGDKIIVHPVTVAKVTYAGAKSITAGTNYKFEDHDIADGIKKDNWVVITPAANTAKHRANIVKAEVVTGKINGKKSSDVKFGDTWYTNVTGSSVNTGDTCDVVVLNGYAFNFDVTAETTKDILFVSGIGKYNAMTGESNGTVKVRAYFTDGTNKEITVRKVNGDKVTGNNMTEVVSMAALTDETLYTYKSTNDGYELTTLRNDKVTGVSKNLAGYDDVITGGASNVYNNKKYTGTSNTSAKSASIADDAVVFVKYRDASGSTDVKIMTGKTVTNWGNTTWGTSGQALIAETNGIDYVKVGSLVASAVRPTASDDALYGYLLEDAYTTQIGTDNTDVIAYHIWNGTTDTTVYEEIGGTVSASNLLSKGSAIRYEVDGEYVTKAASTSIYADAATAVAITGIEYKSKGAVTYRVSAGTSDTKDMDGDCVYIAVDDENHVKHDGGLKDIATAKEQPNGKKVANAYIFTNGSKITAIVFDVPNNELNITPNEF